MSRFAALWENPVVTRETRARWRGRAFAILFGYAILLGGAMLWAYAVASSSPTEYGTANGRFVEVGLERMAHVGHDLFQALTCIQTVAWMLLAPAITATSIAWERETGALEAVQMSPLPGWKVAGGKLLSALLFIGLLLMAALPVTSICFLMGGVSPGEFQAALGLQVATALTGACLGLCCSALCRRANIALTVTFGLMLAWFFGSLLAYGTAIVPWSRSTLWTQITLVFGNSNPLLAAFALISPVHSGLGGAFGMEIWQICLLLQALTWVPLFIAAARATGRPFQEASWMAAHPAKTDKISGAEPAGGTYAAAYRPAVSSRWNAPFIGRIRSRNPVFQREARAKFRLRKLPFIVVGPMMFILLFMAYWYLRAMWWAIDEPYSRVGIWMSVHIIWFFVMVLACVVMGGSGFSREREAGTWEGLGLSLLSAHEIVSAKLRAPMLAVLLYSVPLWPLLALSLLPTSQRVGETLDFMSVVATIVLQAATARFALTLGLFLSWRCKRTSVATGSTVGILLLVWAFIPAFVLSSVSWPAQREWTDFFEFTHPLFSMLSLVDGPASQSGTELMHTLICSGLLWGGSMALEATTRAAINAQRFGVERR